MIQSVHAFAGHGKLNALNLLMKDINAEPQETFCNLGREWTVIVSSFLPDKLESSFASYMSQKHQWKRLSYYTLWAVCSKEGKC